MKRSVKGNVWRRIAGNRQRIEEARDREEREAAALRELNQQPKKEQRKP